MYSIGTISGNELDIDTPMRRHAVLGYISTVMLARLLGAKCL